MILYHCCCVALPGALTGTLTVPPYSYSWGLTQLTAALVLVLVLVLAAAAAPAVVCS